MQKEKYLITEDELYSMVRFGQEYPDMEFYTEPMSDGSPFLSCCFYEKGDRGFYDVVASGFWELDEIKTEA